MAYLGRPGATAPLTTADIPDDSITGAKIVDDAIDSEHYAAGSVDAAHVAADVATQAELDLKANLTNAALVTPNLGTPSAGVVTNLSGVLPVGVTGGSGLTALASQCRVADGAFAGSPTNSYFMFHNHVESVSSLASGAYVGPFEIWEMSSVSGCHILMNYHVSSTSTGTQYHSGRTGGWIFAGNFYEHGRDETVGAHVGALVFVWDNSTGIMSVKFTQAVANLTNTFEWACTVTCNKPLIAPSN